jgi:hypothetical protein
MKKTYIIPAVELLDAETEQVLAASIAGFNSALDDNGVDAGDALAPTFDIFE